MRTDSKSHPGKRNSRGVVRAASIGGACMNSNSIARRAFLVNPDLRLIDIPDQAALGTGERVSHAEMARAIKDAQRECRAQRVRRRAAAASSDT